MVIITNTDEDPPTGTFCNEATILGFFFLHQKCFRRSENVC